MTETSTFNTRIYSELNSLDLKNKKKSFPEKNHEKFYDRMTSIVKYFENSASQNLEIDINCISFALSQDGKIVLLGSCENILFVYDIDKNTIAGGISFGDSQIIKIHISQKLNTYYVLHNKTLSMIRGETSKKLSKKILFEDDIFNFFVNIDENEILVVLWTGKVKIMTKLDSDNEGYFLKKEFSLNVNSKVLSADFKVENSILAIGCENGKIIKCQMDDSHNSYFDTYLNEDITAIAFVTSKINILAGDAKGNLFIIGSVIKKLNNDEKNTVKITAITFADIENFAIVARDDGKVEVWDLKYKNIYQILNVSLSQIRNIKVDNTYNREKRSYSNNNKNDGINCAQKSVFRVFCLNDRKVSIFMVCPSESPKIKKLKNSLKENSLIYSEKSILYLFDFYTISSIETNHFKIINPIFENEDHKYKISILETKKKVLLIYFDDSQIIIKDFCQIIEDINSDETLVKINSDELVSVFNTQDKYFFLSKDFCSVFENKNEIANFYIHTTDIHLMSYVESNQNIVEFFAVTKSQGIQFWKAENYQARNIKLSERSVKSVGTIEEKKFLFIVYNDENEKNLIELWETYKFNIMNSIRLNKFCSFSTAKENWFVALTHDFLFVFSIPDFVKHFSIKIIENPQSFCFFRKDLIIAYKNKLAIFSQFLTQEKKKKIRKILGNSKKIHNIHQKISKVILNSFKPRKKVKKQDNDNQEFRPSGWILEPDHINELHIYAYLNDSKKLFKALKKGVGLFASADGITPLDICLKMKHDQSFYSIYLYLKETRIKNPFIMSIVEDSIIDLIDTKLKSSKKIFKLFLCNSFDKTLPKYFISKPSIFSKKDDLSYHFETSKLIPSSKNLKNLGNQGKGNSVKFKQTYFRFCMKPGSLKSILFLTRVIHNERNIFGHKLEFISYILDQKWKKVKKYTYFMLILYFTYFLIIHLFIFYRNIYFMYTAFGINMIFFLNEVFQIFALKHRHFMIGWAVPNLSNNFLTFAMFILTIYGYNTSGGLEEFTLYTVWHKGYSYFRISRKTGFYVNLLKWLFVDIFGFLLIFLYVTISVAVLAYSVYNFDSFFDAFKFSWELNLGQFDTNGFEGLMYVIFFVASLLCLVVLLNMLIIIMTNTYENVKNQILSSECKEIAQIIRESECLLYLLNYKKNPMKYIFKVTSNIKISSKDQSNDYIFDRKIHSLKNKVKKAILLQKKIYMNAIDRPKSDS